MRASTIIEAAPDRLFVTYRMMNLFKRDKSKKVKCLDLISHGIAVPLNFMRDYTVPMGELSAWNRNRAAIVPIFMPLAFFLLMGFINREKYTVTD